jgi:hypothetical protein
MNIGNDIDFKFDEICSKACTRAGITILVLSAIAIALVPKFESVKTFNVSLGKYIDLRYQLEDALARLLEIDQCWKVLKKSGVDKEATKKWNLLKLKSYKCDPSEAIEKSAQPNISTPPKKESTPPLSTKNKVSPASPTGLRLHLQSSLIEVDEIVDTLSKLADQKLLVDASSFSITFQISINN